jgi:hypothetical protein
MIRTKRNGAHDYNSQVESKTNHANIVYLTLFIKTCREKKRTRYMYVYNMLQLRRCS